MKLGLQEYAGGPQAEVEEEHLGPWERQVQRTKA